MKTLLEEEEKNSPEIREHEVVKGKVVLVNKSEAFIDIVAPAFRQHRPCHVGPRDSRADEE